MQKYDIMGLIGEGAYGVVLKCKCNENKEIVAIKKFKETEDDEIVKKTTMREVKILKMLKHGNIVELKEAFRKKGIVYLVFQYVQNNLLQVLEKTPDGIDSELIKAFIYQLLKGLAYLHSLNIVHRDIKPENLLISDRKELKICDFGFARLLKKGSDEQLTDYVATRWYRPPQLLVGASYGKEIDIWAVGCIFGELIDGNPMFPGQNELDQLFLIQKCLGPLTSDHYETFLKNPRYLGMKFPQIHTLETIDKRYLGKLSPKALNFLKQLLKMNPSDRLSAVDALKHPYFDGIRQQDFIRKLSSNNYIKNQSKISNLNSAALKEEFPPGSVSNERKKYTNTYNPPIYSLNQRQKTEESYYGDQSISNKTGKMNLSKKQPKEDINKLLTSKGFNNNIHSKSVNKTTKGNTKLRQKNISLQKHQNREVLTKTQTGFYIMGGGGVIYEKEQQQDSISNLQHSRNKIYNVKSPKSKNQQRNKNAPTNTEQILEEDQVWQQSTGQLPLLVLGSQQKSNQSKSKNHAQHSQPHQNPHGLNIIITNSTFNYKSHH